MAQTLKHPEFSLERICAAYVDHFPDVTLPAERVSFGTSGHRGKSLSISFNEGHIVAISQAVCDFRKAHGITGPLFMGCDTHALSPLAFNTALEVLTANQVSVIIQHDDTALPTPVISHSILRYNREHPQQKADGIVVTPSHNPPDDGGFKYNEPHGGPSDTITAKWIENRANEYLLQRNAGIKRLSLEKALASPYTVREDLITPYVEGLATILDMQAIATSGLRLGADPLGGASYAFWEPIAAKYKLNITLVNPVLDPSFAFMPLDHDGKVRMDCSSPYAMAGLLEKAQAYDLAFGTDPDGDRHGIVAANTLMNPNHYLSVAIWYLLHNRPQWAAQKTIGKTAVTTHLIDRICMENKQQVYETPVGFKWFVEGLFTQKLVFGGEESAGASFLCHNGLPWSTDKDGILLCLLAAEMMAKTEKNPVELYAALTSRLGEPFFSRIDAPASREQKQKLLALTPDAVTQTHLAGSPIQRIQTHALGNNEAIGGLKVCTQDAWFAARPSGTEDIYKIYAESFQSEAHVAALLDAAKELVATLFSQQ